MKLIVLISAMLLQVLGAAAHAAAESPRIALVIGNGAYSSGPLRNPPNDAQLVGTTLAALGFDVISRRDSDQTGMKRAIQEFGAKLEKAGPNAIGLFFYAGHGVQLNGRNYLIPTGAKIERDGDVDIEAVSAEWVLDQMRFARNRLNIVILDACRNNPFARSLRSADRGLAKMDAPAGVLIAYSTAPGDVAADGDGNNSPYSEALARTMRNSDQPAELMFKQVRDAVRVSTAQRQTPWESSSLTGENFYFASVGKPTRPAAPPVVLPPTPAASAPTSVAAAPAARPAASPNDVCDLPVGRWKTSGNNIAVEGEVAIQADHTVAWWKTPTDKLPAVSGTWTCDPANRRFVFVWGHGSIDTLTLSADGRTLRGSNQIGVQVLSTRLR